MLQWHKGTKVLGKMQKVQRHKGTKVQRCNTALLQWLSSYKMVLLNGMAQINAQCFFMVWHLKMHSFTMA